MKKGLIPLLFCLGFIAFNFYVFLVKGELTNLALTVIWIPLVIRYFKEYKNGKNS